MRMAFFLSYDADACDHVPLDGAVVDRVAAGEEIVSASFVTPYPPGFPVLVPGQVMSPEILSYLRALDVKEIHGYRPEFGLRIFRSEVVRELQKARAGRTSLREEQDRAVAQPSSDARADPTAEPKGRPRAADELTQSQGN